ncbi:MAG: hypothetical protein KDB53_19790, partial [Planctomycetes bacterium]|nr:hypothetical protein [Planctomycetota bacterium]
ACALGMSVVALRGCRQLSARPVLRWLLPLLLFLGPFMLAVTMNEIGVDLVNSRAGYTPMFLVAALTAAAAASGRAGLVGAVLLSTSLAFASRPSQELYVRAHQDVEAALSAMRGSLRSTEVAPADDRAVILGYQELDHFRGSFDLSGAIVPALQRPYMDRDWQIARTASDEPQADHGHWTPFPALFRDASSAYVDRGDGIWMSLVSEGGGYRAPIVYAGAKAAANGGGLTLTWPEPGHVSPLEPSRPETLQPRYVVRTRGLESATLHLTMIAAGGHEFGPLPLDASFVRSRALADGAVEHEVVLPPVSQAILEGLPSRKAYGFFFEARDAEHTVLARSPLRLFFTTRP